MTALPARAAAAIGLAILVLAAPAAPDDRSADVARLLTLLDGIRITYTEAYDDDEGELIRPSDLGESRIMLAEARTLDARLNLVGPVAFATIERELDGALLSQTLPELTRALVAQITAATGLHPETLPPEPPSAARGGVLFHENCAVCHGADGSGDAYDAQRDGVRPPSFTDLTFMRRETPYDFFTMVSLGRRKSGMPEWGRAFTVQQRWDVVAYVWTLAYPAADRAEGERLYATHCASCHGARGEGMDGKAPDLSRPGSLIQRTDLALMTVVSVGRKGMPAFSGTLDARQLWLVANRLRALSLGGVSLAPVAKRQRH